MSASHILLSLKNWSELSLIRAVDYQFAKLLAQTSDHSVPDKLILLSALVSNELAVGNVCLPLSFLQNPEAHWSAEMVAAIQSFDWSEVECFEQVLGNGEETTPLVLDHDRVYLYRYWQYEVYVAEQVQQRSQNTDTDLSVLEESLVEFFPSTSDISSDLAEIDWQKVAAAVAVQKRFAVISGGPGTGKTTTVIKLLAIYLQQMIAIGKKPQIRLAAPTGKAAARLSESINGAKERLDLNSQLADLIPGEATTLHRLLGVIPNSIQFRHDQNNPLHLDILVLDEASMVDLPMMARLLAALPRDARIVLLGDRDQLASVEAGSVLGDICSWPGDLLYSQQQTQQLQRLGCLHGDVKSNSEGSSFADSLSLLRKSYRFDENSGIGHLARAVNQGDPQRFLEITDQGFSDIDVVRLNRDAYEQMIQNTVEVFAELLRKVKSGLSPQQVLKALSEYQLLCALREGPYGVSGINQRIREGLQSRGLVPAEGAWYQGRPIMISQNDSGLNLFNGDIGIALPDENGRIKVWFEQNGELCGFLPSRLPEHDTVYSMTIHKSQGSEYTRVALLLPSEDVPIISRELLYTGITRAKQKLSIYAPERLLRTAIQRKTERAGGLIERMWSRNK